MFQLIKEDKSRRIGRMATALLVVASAVGSNALAQDEKKGEDFSAKVLDLAGHMQHVTVPLYGSLTIETTHEVIRADVVATAITDVQIVSPTLSRRLDIERRVKPVPLRSPVPSRPMMRP